MNAYNILIINEALKTTLTRTLSVNRILLILLGEAVLILICIII